MQDSAEREARSEHPPADVEEAARRRQRIIEDCTGKLVTTIDELQAALLSERTRREKMEEALPLTQAELDQLRSDADAYIEPRLRAAWTKGWLAAVNSIVAAQKAKRSSLESPQ